ncbi:UNVERIFIED_CONTAM: Serine/threonine kinase [Siphonaria sp. JEL0065]|nr:Serine/threonine kinase [Siphonaria sp. JEL0065]
MYALVLFYLVIHHEIAEYDPLWKVLLEIVYFIAVKFVVFFSFWQSIFISILDQNGIIQGTVAWSSDNTSDLIESFLISFEMMIAAFIHLKSFSHKEFVPLHNVKSVSETGKGGHTLEHIPKTRILAGMWDSLLMTDILVDIVEAPKEVREIKRLRKERRERRAISTASSFEQLNTRDGRETESVVVVSERPSVMEMHERGHSRLADGNESGFVIGDDENDNREEAERKDTKTPAMFRNKSAIPAMEGETSIDSAMADHGSAIDDSAAPLPGSSSSTNIQKAASPDTPRAQSPSKLKTQASETALKDEALSPPPSPGGRGGTATTPKTRVAISFGAGTPTTPKNKISFSFKAPKPVAIQEPPDGLSPVRESLHPQTNSETPGTIPNIQRKPSTKSLRNARLSSTNLDENAPRFSVANLFTRKKEPLDDDAVLSPSGPQTSNISLSGERGRTQEKEEPQNRRQSMFTRPSINTRAVSLPAESRRMSLFRPSSSVSPRSILGASTSIRYVEEPAEDTEHEGMAEEYRHNSVTDQALKLLRSLESTSGYLPEYIKRKIPRVRRAIIPHIHQLEERIEEWPWIVDFCEHWGISPMLMVLGILALISFRKLYQRNVRLISAYIEFIYPLYKTIRMLLSPSDSPVTPNRITYNQTQSYANTAYELGKWKAYWPIYGGVLLLDEFSSALLTIFPFYYTTRSVFCYWLYNNNGANYIFYKYLEPLWQTGVNTITNVDQTVAYVTNGKTVFDYKKETQELTPDVARQRLIAIWYKIRSETRFNESCQNILKSIVLNRDHILASKDERNLREDIEKSQDKLALLVEAEKRYKKLINWFVDENGLPEETANNTKINGQLRIKIERISLKAHTDLIPPTKQKLDIFAIITINDFPKATTSKISSQLRDETFELPIDKLSNRVEIQVYQTSLLANHQLIGVCWFTIADLKEELLDKYFSLFPVDVPEIVLTLEPAGYLVLKANLVELTRQKQNAISNDIFTDLKDEDIYLADDIRKVYARNGHQFQIYKAVNSIGSDVIGARCSVCEESMIGGMRCFCQRCAFVCHTRCYKGVLTKCINHDDIQKAPIGTDLNTGQLLDYNKPHNFETRSLNLLRSWCTHCGLKVMVGERLVQCAACGKCSHEKCKPFVPNFCGLSLADAAAIAIKEDFKDKKRLGAVLGFAKNNV